jgi:hypothetical protein
MSSEAGARLPTERHADPDEGGGEVVAAPSTGGDETRQALGEGPLGAVGGAAEEATGVDDEGESAPGAGEIGDAALVARMDGLRGAMAARTPRGSARGLGSEGEVNMRGELLR